MATETAETRAAIERLRRWRSGEDWTAVYPGNHQWAWHRWTAEQMQAIDLYLAEHPADDAEPVTEEWLRSVGFEKHDALWQWSKSNGLKMPSRLVYWPGYRGDGTQWHIDGGPRAKDIYDIPEQPTRGDVRRLCAALGIPLAATS